MPSQTPGRRLFLQSLAGLWATGIAAGATPPNKRETGTLRPSLASGSASLGGTALRPLRFSRNAADCHIHIYDSNYPVDPQAKLRPPDATVADYRRVQKLTRTSRVVLVQPSTYGVDNRCMLAAVRQFGASARGVAVVNAQVSDDELKQLQTGGVRGIRFNLAQAGATTLDMLPPLAKRIADLGWHVQINAPAGQILPSMSMLKALPVPVVFDHLAHVAKPGDAEFQAIAELLHKGRAWVKLSGAYMDSKDRRLMPIAGPSPKRSSGRLRNGWFGARIGPIRRPTTSLTICFYSTCSKTGAAPRRYASACWFRTPNNFTGSGRRLVHKDRRRFVPRDADTTRGDTRHS